MLQPLPLGEGLDQRPLRALLVAGADFDARGFFNRTDEGRELWFEALEQFGEGHELERGKASEFGFDGRLARGFVTYALGRHALNRCCKPAPKAALPS